jgi:hypothetical protein
MPENISLAGAINNESLSDQDQLALIKGELNRIVASFRDIMAEIDILQEDVARERAQDLQRIAALEHGNRKMLGSDARRMMHPSESRFSELPRI